MRKNGPTSHEATAFLNARLVDPASGKAEIGLLKRAGAIAFTNGKSSVANARVMRNVLLYAKDHGTLVVHHTEDPHLTEGSVMNAGEVATRLGLPGVHKAAETIIIERDLWLVEITGGRYHASNLSCA